MARLFTSASSDIITLANGGTTLSLTGVMSAAFWLKTTTTTGSVTMVIGNQSSGAVASYIITPSYSAFVGKVTFWNDGGGPSAGASVTTNDGNWHHLVCVRTGSTGNWTIAFYVDGVASGSTSGIATNPTAGGFAAIGGSNVGFPPDATLADMALWNVALTATEALGLSRGIRPNRIRPTALVAWLPLDGIASTEPDLSGGKSNGTVTGTAKAFGPPFAPFTPRWPPYLLPPVPPTFILMPQIVM